MSTIYDPRYKILVNGLKSMRLQAGLTQIDLAQKLGSSQAYVSKYESGQRRLDVIETMIICRALGTSFVNFVEDLEKNISVKNVK